MLNTFLDVSRLKVSEITVNPDVNIRELDSDYVAELMQSQLEYGEGVWQSQWKEKPKINQDGVLFSGFHTIAAVERNFGTDHEVYFEVAEGDPYLLAAGENSTHGKRRTNADKRAAVLRWLEDEEGKQWTDSHIAKMCHVHHDTVGKVAISLAESAGENYERPTRRRYIDKHGNVSWMETAKINEPDETDDSQSELDLEIPSEAFIQTVQRYQLVVRTSLHQFADTTDMFLKAEHGKERTLLGYKAFSRWGEEYLLFPTSDMDASVSEKLNHFAFGEMDAGPDSEIEDYWKESGTLVKDIPEDTFLSVIHRIEKLTDIEDTSGYFGVEWDGAELPIPANALMCVILKLERLLQLKKKLLGKLEDIRSIELETLSGSVSSQEFWEALSFRALLDSEDVIDEGILAFSNALSEADVQIQGNRVGTHTWYTEYGQYMTEGEIRRVLASIRRQFTHEGTD